jgi:hypothetical protein
MLPVTTPFALGCACTMSSSQGLLDPLMACSRTARFFFPRPLGGAHFPHPMPARCSGSQVFLSTPLVSM